MPPSAAAPAYDAEYAHDLMQEAQAGSESSLFTRAMLALLYTAFGLFILLSILSYSPYDNSLDTAGIGPVRNLLGAPGAQASNLFMQLLGWGGLVAGFIFIYSGLRTAFKYVPRTRFEKIARGCWALGFLLFGSATLSAFPIPLDWPMASGMGGWIGDGLFLSLKKCLSFFNLPIAGLLAGIVFLLPAALCAGRFMGVVKKDVMDVWDAAGLAWATLRVWFDRFVDFISRRVMRAYDGELQAEGGSDSVYRDVAEGRDAPLPQERTYPVSLSETEASLAPNKLPDIEYGVNETAPAAERPVAASVDASARKRRAAKPKKPKFNFADGDDFVLPGVDLLKTPPPRKTVRDEGALRKASDDLHRVMEEYGIKGEMGAVHPGPVVTLFEFEPAPGVKSQRVINLAPDIARNMSAISARIAVVPGRNAMGVELPNRRRETVWLRDMLSSPAYQNTDASLPLVMGEDIGGSPFIADLSKMPHLLVAGTTGSGKSVAINAMILSLMYKLTPEECKFIMIDPKMLELSVYDSAPHLLAPVVTEPKKAVVALKWTVREMEDRYRKMAKMGVRNMAGFNEKVREAERTGEVMSRTVMTGYNKESGEPTYETEELKYEPMPFIVVIIDEMADLMMVAGKDIEGTVQRLAQMARAAGIHMIMATQRPSVDVITGTIKANFPTRVAFRVGSSIDSRTILGETGAEQLLGNGDMLFMGTGRPRRLHGPFISDGEVEKIAAFVKAQGSPSYLEDITAETEDMGDEGGALGSDEENSLFDKAVAIVAMDRKASTSYIQRRLSIGYNRAANLIEQMETEGMIGPSGPGGKREIFLPEQGAY